jgi:hypothetical protein
MSTQPRTAVADFAQSPARIARKRLLFVAARSTTKRRAVEHSRDDFFALCEVTTGLIEAERLRRVGK